MYSAGDCSVCGSAGGAIFLTSVLDGRVFFSCPACGCAWARPPTPFVVDSADPPTTFAPGGFCVASRDDIERAGLADLIRDDDHWLSSFGFADTDGYRQ
jgi:hypothetical protein